MKIKGGATMWSRQTIESDIFYNKPDKWFKVWFYIVNHVNHKKNKQFKRGEGFFRYLLVEEYTGASKNQIYRCLRWLEKEGMIGTHKTTRGVIIKVINYDLYQNLENYKRDPSETQRRYEGYTINKNDNNENNEKGTIKKHIFLGYFEKNPVYSFEGKTKIKCPDGEWRYFMGSTKDIKPNK